MKNVIVYLTIAIITGGAIPIIISYLTRKSKRKGKEEK